MNQYLPDSQPSKSCFVRLRLTTKCRHLSVINGRSISVRGRPFVCTPTRVMQSVSQCEGHTGYLVITSRLIQLRCSVADLCCFIFVLMIAPDQYDSLSLRVASESV